LNRFTAETPRTQRSAEETLKDWNDISGAIVDAAIQVHSALGPGLLESTYTTCLAYELQQRGLAVQTQAPLPVVYKHITMPVGYRVDLIVEDAVIVELKTVASLLPIHRARLLTYLRLSGRRLGLLLNSHVPRMRDGIKRLVNRL